MQPSFVHVFAPTIEVASDSLDGLIYAIGYEARSRFIASEFQDRFAMALGVRLGSQEECSFPSNLAWSSEQESVEIVLGQTETEVRDHVRSWLKLVHDKVSGRRMLVGVDISSFPRVHLAAIVSELCIFGSEVSDVVAHFLYAPAEYSAPSTEPSPVVKFGAVTSDFAGISDTGFGLASVIGLGYEPDLALAAQQVLDPATTWLAVPRGQDPLYDAAVESANRRVIDICYSTEIWHYSVSRPFDAFIKLESIVAGLRQTQNVVLVPFGPKIFAVICLLIGLVHAPDVGVWRVSSGRFGHAVDQHASGEVIALGAEFVGHRVIHSDALLADVEFVDTGEKRTDDVGEDTVGP
jgi:hypothetical protein